SGGARGTRLVDDDDLDAEGLGEDRRGDACHLVGRSTRAPGHDDVDWAIGLPLLRRGGNHAKRQSRYTASQGKSHCSSHELLPGCWLVFRLPWRGAWLALRPESSTK